MFSGSVQTPSKCPAISKDKILMQGQNNLDQLLQGMSPVVHSEIYVFCSFPGDALPAGLTPICTFREEEGWTAILPKPQAQAFGFDFEFESTLITLSVHSSLAAVGFLAQVCAALAALNIPCNAVSGFYHDHLFVPTDRLGDALLALKQLSVRAA
jgi:hypothetical protein